MVKASMNGTSYSVRADMDIGEQTLEVSSLTTPIAGVPIQVNSDIQNNGKTRCFDTVTLDYSGNAAGVNNSREYSVGCWIECECKYRCWF